MKRRLQSGHAMIELAVSAAVMVTCIAGTFQFGYTFYVYNQLVTAVGNGGRYAAVRPWQPDVEKTNQAIRNLVAYGDPQPAPGARPVVNGLKPELIDVNWTMQSGKPEAVSIAIRDFSIDAVFSKFNFHNRPGVEFPYVGQPAK